MKTCNLCEYKTHCVWEKILHTYDVHSFENEQKILQNNYNNFIPSIEILIKEHKLECID